MPRPPLYRNLEQRGQTYYVVVEVPPSLRKLIGRKRLRKTTGTTDKALAVLRRGAILVELQKQLEAARGRKLHEAGEGLAGEALAWQRELGVAHKDAAALNDLEGALTYRLEEIELEGGADAAQTFNAIVRGKATPLTFHLEDWLREKAYKPRQEGEFRKVVKGFAAWLVEQKMAEAVEAVTDKVATSFKLKTFTAQGADHATANKKLSALSSYWRWLLAHGLAEVNPWRGKFFPKKKLPAHERERPFTDEEIVTLLNGPANHDLWDFMVFGALSGMRREEICQLRKRDCGGEIFQIRDGKTEAAMRIVPVHPRLKGMVKARLEGKPEDAFLFDASRKGWGDTRGDEEGKEFLAYRRGLGVDDRREGRRRSLVNFHSFRRWFITKADRAGCRVEDVERCVGHKPQGMTLGVYSAGLLEAQLRPVVEAVKLPAVVVERGDRPPEPELPRIKLKRPRSAPQPKPSGSGTRQT